MPRGVSLHVGINRVSVEAFSARGLVGCEHDAVAMSNIALSQGFRPEDVRLLLGPAATFDNVKSAILEAAAGPNRLVSGDIFLFTFAGHGSRIPNPELEESLINEQDGHDESIVLFDRLMLDDYLNRVLWPRFAEGVRIVGVADSCHSATALFAVSDVDITVTEHTAITISNASGGVTRLASARTVKRLSRNGARRRPQHRRSEAPADHSTEEEVVTVGGLEDRAISRTVREAHRSAFKSFYEDLDVPSPAAAPPIGASLLLMAACEDGATTKDGLLHTDGLLHGGFTRALLQVWNDGMFEGNYVTFMNAIQSRIASDFPGQVPILTPEIPPAFSVQHPFSV